MLDFGSHKCKETVQYLGAQLSCYLQWNLDLTKCQGTGKVGSLYRVFVIFRFGFHIFYSDLIFLG